MARINLGRNVYGLAAVVFGIVTFVWHDFNSWQQNRAFGNVPHREILVYIAAVIEPERRGLSPIFSAQSVRPRWLFETLPQCTCV